MIQWVDSCRAIQISKYDTHEKVREKKNLRVI